jgi:hypothetical protein
MHNVMYTEVRPSVRNEVSQSFFFFFHFFKNTKKWQNLVEARFRTQDLSKMEIWMYGRTDVLNEVIFSAKMEISM